MPAESASHPGRIACRRGFIAPCADPFQSSFPSSSPFCLNRRSSKSFAKGSIGFTLTEVLVAVLIVLLLAALLLPGMKRAVDSAKTSGCLANLRQLGVGVSLYGSDHDGKFPAKVGDYPNDANRARQQQWDSQIAPYLFPELGDDDLYAGVISGRVKSPSKVFHCPAAQRGPYPPIMSRSYAMNEYLAVSYAGQASDSYYWNNSGGPANHSLSGLNAASETILLIEFGLDAGGASRAGNLDSNLAGGNSDLSYVYKGLSAYYPYEFRHGGKINVVFADGHIDRREPSGSLTSGRSDDREPKNARYFNKY